MRRVGKLQVALTVMPKDQAVHVAVDSTGVKVYGEGEWKTRQHGSVSDAPGANQPVKEAFLAMRQAAETNVEEGVIESSKVMAIAMRLTTIRM